MDKPLSPEQKALIAAQDALLAGRQLLETVMSQLLGVAHDAPSGSRIMEVLTEMRAAQRQTHAALLGKES